MCTARLTRCVCARKNLWSEVGAHDVCCILRCRTYGSTFLASRYGWCSICCDALLCVWVRLRLPFWPYRNERALFQFNDRWPYRWYCFASAKMNLIGMERAFVRYIRFYMREEHVFFKQRPESVRDSGNRNMLKNYWYFYIRNFFSGNKNMPTTIISKIWIFYVFSFNYE